MNVLSIDLESWVHKYFLNYTSQVKNKKDGKHICKATLDTLKILDRFNVKTSFFIVSEIFEWHPWLIQKIKDKGHEIGFQTHSHRILFRKNDLIEELKNGKKFIDEFNPQGFRAPQVFMRKEYLPVLKDWGFIYDSSIYAEFKIFKPVEGMFEIPISTYPIFKKGRSIRFPRKFDLQLLKREIPFGSGYFIGLLGINIQWFIKRLNKKNVPTNLFIHTWQITEPPLENKNINENILNRFKMYPYNINRRDAIEYLFNKFKFIPLIELINNYNYIDRDKSLKK